jgi:CYTH domain-containing protein
LGIDVFDPPLHGQVLAEAEFTTDEAAQSFLPPRAAIAEVTDDARFTGSSLVQTRRHDLLAWLAEYGIRLQETEWSQPSHRC